MREGGGRQIKIGIYVEKMGENLTGEKSARNLVRDVIHSHTTRRWFRSVAVYSIFPEKTGGI